MPLTIKQSKHLYEFGPFRLDPAESLLLRAGQPVPLSPKAFEMLVMLVERSGHLVEKSELMGLLWPDSFVEESNLTHHVWTLRKALGEDSQQYIETVPKRGYRFVASVREFSGESLEAGAETRAPTRSSSEARELIAPSQSGQLLRPKAFETEASRRREAGRRRNRSRLAYGLLALSLMGGAATLLYVRSASDVKQLAANTAHPATLRSFAALPFKAVVAEASDEYLELGMVDALITKLSNLKGINVRPLSAVRKYTGLQQDPLAAGRELRVETVLEGNVQRAGERLRVTVRLLSVPDGTSLWGQTFDEKWTDIFTVQDSISERVAAALSLQLTSDERRLITKHYTENAEAYRLYVTGRFFANKRTGAGFQKAIEYFNEAIEQDPRYALAYVGLADSYQLLTDYDLLSLTETQTKAKAAALKALEIDDTLAEAHASLADIVKFYDWEWAGAEREYRRAIELNPNYATAHQWYAEYLAAMGRHGEAIAEIERALQLDPLSVVTHSAAGWVFLFARQYDRAIAECHKVIELDPSYIEVYSQLRRAYEQKGMYVEALAADEKYRMSKGRGAGQLAKTRDSQPASAQTYWQGRLAVAEKYADQEITTLRLAEIHAQLGEKDQAFAWLEKAYQQHSFWMPYLRVHPHLDPLRSDPRFTDLLRRVGLTTS